MSTRKVWVVEEIATDAGIGQRQTEGSLNNNDSTSKWSWIRPDNRLTVEQQTEWDRVLTALNNVNGEDLRHIVCFAGLLDHCLRPATTSDYE